MSEQLIAEIYLATALNQISFIVLVTVPAFFAQGVGRARYLITAPFQLPLPVGEGWGEGQIGIAGAGSSYVY
ncbi:hypothetical protein BFS14_17705 [Serratia fonticola]|uniref:hypothetical protein n=1 Tax=Serratia fonticola TaxID=47917 RepID=UPI0008FD43EC|nr:hypothetical protein [Serratia fonticola]OIX93592.1 hypothetical protein BFS14_17705 [Serratia fonticola]QCR59166.1 hypothetical protein FD644_01860 [Serratia fonticola]